MCNKRQVPDDVYVWNLSACVTEIMVELLPSPQDTVKLGCIPLGAEIGNSNWVPFDVVSIVNLKGLKSPSFIYNNLLAILIIHNSLTYIVCT